MPASLIATAVVPGFVAGTVRGLFVSLRPRQWVKNLFVFAGLIFAQRLFTPDAWRAIAAFAIFCALSGAIYILNDVADRERDRVHPQKRERPVASGQLRVHYAITAAAILIAGSLMAGFALTPYFALVSAVYVALLSAYSAQFKHIVIVDVLTVACGFVLRALAGTVVIDVAISGWLLLCTMLVALFLALGKRRHEYVTLEAAAMTHRPILAEYSGALLDQMIGVVTASTITAYALYTMAPETIAKFHTQLLPITLLFVVYGVFRYLYLLYRRQLGGNPSELLLHDRPLLVNTLLWIAAVLSIIYGTRPE